MAVITSGDTFQNNYSVGYVPPTQRRSNSYKEYDPDINLRISNYKSIENVDPLANGENGKDRQQMYTRYASSIENRFFRYGYYNADEDPFLTGNTYMFMTRPYLNLNGQQTETNFYRNNFIVYMANHYSSLVQALCFNENTSNFSSPFIPLLSNRFKKIDVNDVALNESTSNETWKGYSIRMGTTYAGSVNGGSFNISYDEMQIPKVTYLHKIWIEYIEAVKSGMMSPAADALNYKELDYVTSVYVFGLMPDGETINFWAKYTGVFPKSLPYSSLLSGKGEIGAATDISIEYGYSFREVYDVEILNEFNYVATKSRLSVAGARSDSIDLREINGGGLYSFGYKYDNLGQAQISSTKFSGSSAETRAAGKYVSPYIAMEKVKNGSSTSSETRFKLKFI